MRWLVHTSTPTESASSLPAALPFTFAFVLVDASSVATESLEVSPSGVGPGTASALDGRDIVVSPAEVDEVDFRGMEGLERLVLDGADHAGQDGLSIKAGLGSRFERNAKVARRLDLGRQRRVSLRW